MNFNETDKKVNISVPELVFVTCRRKERFQAFDNALNDDPSFAMSVAQREAVEAGKNYYSNVNLSCSLKIGEYLLELNGKTSVLVSDGKYTIDIVKSVRYPVRFVNEKFVYSWCAEGKILGFILAKKHNLQDVTVRVSVFHTETLERKVYDFNFTSVELEAFSKNTLSEFFNFGKPYLEHITERNKKSETAAFPFSSAREGQKDISKEVYSAIKNRHNAIVNAPTGLGKTVSTLYPALKAQGKGLYNKVFYLTAKNTGNNSVVDSVELFRKAGFDVIISVISAKSKICERRPCSPQTCNFPQGHHERMISAVLDIINHTNVYDSKTVQQYAKKYNVCPFMLELELIWFADVVVCDYNYVFDPKVYVKIQSSFSGNDVILVDEAHNLIDRLRNIFSSEIDLNSLSKLLKAEITSPQLKESINSFLDFIKLDKEDNDMACEPMSSQSLDGFEREINSLYLQLQNYFEENNDVTSSVKSLYGSVKVFVELITSRSDRFISFYNDYGNPEIFMVNTSDYIFESSKRLGSIVMFSATLFPEEYYKYMLGARKKDIYVSFPSPFDSNNFLVLAYNLSTKYSDRQETVEDVVRAIWSAGRVKQGNYISFFPSYQYMMLAVDTFARLFPNEKIIFQKNSMTELEREEFISSFKEGPGSTLYAFAVLGGTFSEGIDLTGDKLSGATVVGLGSLPPSRKGVLISSYFNDMFFDGEKFAYHYPGLNKVFQAGGRVIRSEKDKGFLLIIDDRFLTEENIELLPDSWTNIKRVKNNNQIASFIDEFWSK